MLWHRPTQSLPKITEKGAEGGPAYQKREGTSTYMAGYIYLLVLPTREAGTCEWRLEELPTQRCV